MKSTAEITDVLSTAPAGSGGTSQPVEDLASFVCDDKLHARIHSVRKGRFKLIRYPGQGRDFFELYDLEEDPLETRNIAAEQPELRMRLQEDLDAWYDGIRENPAPTPSEKEREGLRSLGYLPE